MAEGLLADCSTRIIYRQESDQVGPAAQLLGLTDVERDAIQQLPLGRGLWKVRDRSFVVQHRMGTAELEAFDTNARMTEAAASDPPDVLQPVEETATPESPGWPSPAEPAGSSGGEAF